MKKSFRIIEGVLLVGLLSWLFSGCRVVEPMDGPGMVYEDSTYRTEYANVFPESAWDSQSDLDCVCAVAYLGRGAEGEEAREQTLARLFGELKETEYPHFDFGGEDWFLVIPRHGSDYLKVRGPSGEEETKPRYDHVPFTVCCSQDAAIYNSKYEFLLRLDEAGKLDCGIYAMDVTDWEVTP